SRLRTSGAKRCSRRRQASTPTPPDSSSLGTSGRPALAIRTTGSSSTAASTIRRCEPARLWAGARLTTWPITRQMITAQDGGAASALNSRPPSFVPGFRTSRSTWWQSVVLVSLRRFVRGRTAEDQLHPLLVLLSEPAVGDDRFAHPL